MIESVIKIILLAAVTFFAVLAVSIVVVGIAVIVVDRCFRWDFEGEKGIAQGIVKVAVPCRNPLLWLRFLYIRV